MFSLTQEDDEDDHTNILSCTTEESTPDTTLLGAPAGEWSEDVNMATEEALEDVNMEGDEQVDAGDVNDDEILTDDEDTNHEMAIQEHIQGPGALSSFLDSLTCSRDIDSISILSPSATSLLRTMESRAVVKISSMVGNFPTTSSRHCVKQRIRGRGGQLCTKKTPLHHFQNICLGTVTANNIRFHLNIYSLQHEGSGKSKGYRPMTTSKRLILVACLNLARMLQCNRAKRIQQAWDKFCSLVAGASTITDVNVEGIGLIWNNYNDGVPQIKHPQHWVSGGELFYLKHNATKASEVSTTRDNALCFFHYFEKALDLIAYGILFCEEIWNWCFSKVDMDAMTGMGATCSKASLTEGAKNLSRYKMFGLTAAGTKDDFPKFDPYYYCGETEASSVEQFIEWMRQAGGHNLKNLCACFDDAFDFDRHGVTITVDDGLVFNTEQKRIMLLPALPSMTEDESYNSDEDNDDEDEDEDDNDNISQGVEDKNDEDDPNDQQGLHQSDVIEDDYGINYDEENDDDDDDDDDEGDDSGQNQEVSNDNVEDPGLSPRNSTGGPVDETRDDAITLTMLSPTGLNKYPVLLNPWALTFHTGKIICTLPFTNTGIYSLEVKGNGQGNAQHGETVGYQAYLTSAKNTKGAGIFRNISKLGNLEKASFGLMHESLEMDMKEYRVLMDECLEQLRLLDFSKSALSDTMSRSFCLRLECFRYFKSVQEGNEAMKNYSFDVLNMNVFLCHKDKMLRNYYSTLRLAKDVITRVFTSNTDNQSLVHNPRNLSPSAKTGIQFLSEVLTFDVGTPSGYSRQGPITRSLIAVDESMKLFGLHYPNEGPAFDSHEANYTGLPHGMDPNLWSFNDGLNLHDEVKRALGYTDLSPTSQLTSMPISDTVNTKNVEKLRKDIGKRLFRFKKNNKDRDKCSWLLLISHFIVAATGDNTDGSMFSSIECESIVSLFETNKIQELEQILDILASIFWLCYDWEWRTDILTNPQFQGIDVALDAWPTTVDGLKQKLIEAQPKNKNKSLGSVEQVKQELFQQHDKKPPKSANWTYCTYVHLYTHILRILTAAREKVYERLGSQHIISQRNAYILSAPHFLGKICRTLIRRSGHGDMPYVWKTTNGNRKKDVGKYVSIDVNSLERSTMELEMNVKGHVSGGNSGVLLQGTIDNNNMKGLRDLSHGNLHKTLMQIPYVFSLDQEGTASHRSGSFIAVAHVLIGSLLYLYPIQNRGVGDIWDRILAVDASQVYDLLQDDDPFLNVSSRLTLGMKYARLSCIHLLWDSKESFVLSARKVKKAIKSRLGKNGPSSTGFKLDDLEVAIEQFTFSCRAESIAEMIDSSNRRFTGINHKLAVQLKVLCLLIYLFELQRRRERTSRIKMNRNSASHQTYWRDMVCRCHTEESYILVKK